MRKELEIFLNKTPENNKDKVVRLFTDNFNEKVTPIYCLTKDGEVSDNIFLATVWCKATIKKKLKDNLPDMKLRLREDIFCTSSERWAGYWVEFVS